MSGLVMAIEGGGTKTRILLGDMEGNILAEERTTSASPLYIDPETYAQHLRDLLQRVHQVMETCGARVIRVGLAAPMDLDLVKSTVHRIFGQVHFIQASEGDIALMLHDLQVGVALVAGTGCSCHAINEQGERITCGGYGPQFGDEGSGYWIGREAIKAVARAEEGRAPETLLQERIYRVFEIGNYWDILRYCNGNGHLPVPRVAALTAEVFEAAEADDEVAQSICTHAGMELGRLVLDTASGSGIERIPIPLAPTGGVFQGAHLILPGIELVLRESSTPFEILRPEVEPVQGLLKLLIA